MSPNIEESSKPNLLEIHDNVLDINVELSDKQKLAQNSNSAILLYGGAKGGGKSWWLCWWIFISCLQYPGAKLFFCRRRSVDFTNTTLETWKKAVPQRFCKINEQKKKITVQLGGMRPSVIDYGGLDDPLLIQSLNSAEYSHIGVDQAEEIEEDQFSMLRATLRHRLADGTEPPYQIRMTANPAQCWLKDAFILGKRQGFEYIQALPQDNPYLPKGYVTTLEEAFKHRPQLLEAYLHGSWDDLSGFDICIASADIRKSIDRQKRGSVSKRIIVNDPSHFGDDENVIYVMEECENCAYIIYQQILEHRSTMDTAGRLSSLRRKYEASLIAIDSIGIGAGVYDALTELDENVYSIKSSFKPTLETAEKKYFNLRSQLWMEAGEIFARGRVSLSSHDTILHSQLSSLKYEFTSNGRIKVESKDEVKKRASGKSPDRADAFIMGLYALGLADKLESAGHYEEDRAGHGIAVEVEDTVSSVDYSGYSFAE